MTPAVLIAESHDDARAWLDAQPSGWAFYGGHRVVIVTPRTPHAARGIEAEAVLSTEAARAHPAYDRLLAETMPCVAWRRATDGTRTTVARDQTAGRNARLPSPRSC